MRENLGELGRDGFFHVYQLMVYPMIAQFLCQPELPGFAYAETHRAFDILTFVILTRETFFLDVGGVAGGLGYL